MKKMKKDPISMKDMKNIDPMVRIPAFYDGCYHLFSVKMFDMIGL